MFVSAAAFLSVLFAMELLTYEFVFHPPNRPSLTFSLFFYRLANVLNHIFCLRCCVSRRRVCVSSSTPLPVLINAQPMKKKTSLRLCSSDGNVRKVCPLVVCPLLTSLAAWASFRTSFVDSYVHARVLHCLQHLIMSLWL